MSVPDRPEVTEHVEKILDAAYAQVRDYLVGLARPELERVWVKYGIDRVGFVNNSVVVFFTNGDSVVDPDADDYAEDLRLLLDLCWIISDEVGGPDGDYL